MNDSTRIQERLTRMNEDTMLDDFITDAGVTMLRLTKVTTFILVALLAIMGVAQVINYLT